MLYAEPFLEYSIVIVVDFYMIQSWFYRMYLCTCFTAKLQGRPKDYRHVAIEWLLFIQTSIWIMLGISFIFIFPVFWYINFTAFQPLVSECQIVNIVSILCLSAALFQSTQWFSFTCALALIYCCSVNSWLKFPT
jgi:hypothetical protein